MDNEIPEKLHPMAFAFADHVPQKVYDDVRSFAEGKKDFVCYFSSTPIVTGMVMIGKVPTAQTQVIISAFVTWNATKKEKEDFELNERAKKGIIKSN